MKEKRGVYRFLHVRPRRIFDQLDGFVVGQKKARRTMENTSAH
jgi:ATP-dependent protease HslVU (ClpYQ) ATPase subunit